MSEPTYHIEIRHDPTEYSFPWIGTATRLSDGTTAAVSCGNTSVEALGDLQIKLKQLDCAQEPQVFYLDESGDLCPDPEPQSLRA